MTNSQRFKLICLVPSLQTGGMERVMATLLGEFSQKPGLELHLIIYGRKREVFFPLPEGVHLHVPPFEFDDHSRAVSTLKTALFLRRKIRSLRADRVLSFGELWNSFVLFSLLGAGQKLIISDRCSPAKRFGRIQEFLRGWLYPKAHSIIVQTETAKDIYGARWRASRFHVIGNPVFVPDAVSAEGREKRVLNVARLIDSKHHDRLIEMFSRTAPPDWELMIIGGDAQGQAHMDRLKKLAAESPAADRIHLAGTRDDVADWYKSSRIFAFPSSSEGFPNALAEAMAFGLAPVSYDCCAGPADLIEDGVSGFLTPVFDDDAFAARLRSLMENDEEREKIGAAAHQHMRRFDKAAIADRYLTAIMAD